MIQRFCLKHFGIMVSKRLRVSSCKTRSFTILICGLSRAYTDSVFNDFGTLRGDLFETGKEDINSDQLFQFAPYDDDRDLRVRGHELKLYKCLQRLNARKVFFP